MKLMIGVPTHSGTLTSATTDTLLKLQKALLERGDDFEIEFYSGPVIADLRNAIVADFLQREADALLMVDSDMGAMPQVVLRMIDFDRPLVGCMYPKRLFNFEPTVGKIGDLPTLLQRSMQFVGRLETRTEGQIDLVLDGGFARALHLGTGLLLMRREVFEKMKKAYPDLAGRGFNPEAFPGPRFEQNWGFFNPLAVATGGSNLAEDFSFCLRWREAGGEVWAEVESPIAHVGVHRFTSSFATYLTAHRKHLQDAGEAE